MSFTREHRLRALGMTYSEYLKSSLWQASRKRYHENGGRKSCLVCGKRRYHLHHLTYTRLGRELPGDLVPLCPSCHERVHRFHRNNSTNLQHLGVVLQMEFGWTKKKASEAMRSYNVNGVKDAKIDPGALTPRQRVRFLIREKKRKSNQRMK